MTGSKKINLLVLALITGLLIVSCSKSEGDNNGQDGTNKEEVKIGRQSKKILQREQIETFSCDASFKETKEMIYSYIVNYDNYGNVVKMYKPFGLNLEASFENKQLLLVQVIAEASNFRFRIKPHKAEINIKGTTGEVVFDDNNNLKSYDCYVGCYVLQCKAYYSPSNFLRFFRLEETSSNYGVEEYYVYEYDKETPDWRERKVTCYLTIHEEEDEDSLEPKQKITDTIRYYIEKRTVQYWK